VKLISWSAQKTWAAGEIVLLTQFNANIRNALIALDQHRHSGAAGDGRANLAADIIGVNQLGIVTTKGDLITYDTQPARLGIGANGQALRADSREDLGIKWASVSISSVTGSYIGSGIDEQEITGLGLRPKYLIIWEQHVSATPLVAVWWTTDFIVDDLVVGGVGAGGCIQMKPGSGNPMTFQANRIKSLDADGFTVSNNASDESDRHPNEDEITYEYIAFGE
jgi:hypothetical protein